MNFCRFAGGNATARAAMKRRSSRRHDIERVLTAFLFVFLVFFLPAVSPCDEALGKGLRERLIQADSEFAFSSEVLLTAEEKKADAALDRLRTIYLKQFASDPDRPYKTPFLVSRRELTQNGLHKALGSMPKGGMLHIHATATGTVEWIVERALSMPDCFIYWKETNGQYVHGQIGFFPAGSIPAGWMLLSELQASRPNIRKELEDLFSLGPEDLDCPDIWREFEAIFTRIDGFISYRPVFLDYYQDAFETLAKDKIQFLELRTSLDSILTETGGHVVDEEVIELYLSILDRVRKKYPGFDLAIIVCSFREASLDDVRAKMALERRLAAEYPDMVIGFDLIGEEDRGKSSNHYAPVLGSAPAAPLFLHGGESLSPANFNVLDAWLLGSLRIGHAINLVHFQTLERRIRKTGTVLELCPISNQSLGYVPDLRLHPARGFLMRGMQSVLGSDDPEIFRSKGLTDDFFEAYVAWDMDLRSLKKLTRNSIVYSHLAPSRTRKHLRAFTERWTDFIRTVNAKSASGGETP